MSKKKKKFEQPESQKQMPIFTEPEDIKEIEEELEVTDEILAEIPEIEKKNIPWTQTPDNEIKVKSFCMVKGSIKEKNLKLKVISIYDLSGVETTPDAELLEGEIDAYVQKTLNAIDINSKMIAKSLGILTRGQ